MSFWNNVRIKEKYQSIYFMSINIENMYVMEFFYLALQSINDHSTKFYFNNLFSDIYRWLSDKTWDIFYRANIY